MAQTQATNCLSKIMGLAVLPLAFEHSPCLEISEFFLQPLETVEVRATSWIH